MSAPRVLELLGPSTGGIGRHVAYLTAHLRGAGWDVVTAGPAGVLDDLDHVVPVPGGFDPRQLLASRRALAPLAGSVDLVHAHGLKVGWLAATLRPRPPLILSVHNLVLDEAAGRSAPVLRWLEGRLPARVDATIAISGEVARRFDGLPGADRIHVVPPAGPPPRPTRRREEVRAELGLAPEDDLVVTAARLHPQKGLHVLLDAAALAAQRRPQLRWFVFGDGPLRMELTEAIHRRGLGDTVHLAGRRDAVDSELAAADAVVVTSQWESGPLVLLEALALGRPVVSTRVGLAPEAVDGTGGRIVEVGDASALADALVEVLADAPASGGRVAGSDTPFRPAALASAVEDVYREVLRTR